MTLHIFNDVTQGTSDWHDLRRGLVTASTVGKLITVGTPDALAVGCPTCKAEVASPCISAARKTPTPIKTFHPARTEAASELPPVYTVASDETSTGLTLTLVAERITDRTEDTPMTSDMYRGVESEPYARDVYSGFYDQAVECGFMVREEDGWQLGYSPDGLVGEEGLIEIKAPRAKTQVRTVLNGEVPAQYMPQLQSGLLVTGRKWIDFCSFNGGMAMYVKRVYPDPAWFAVIQAACRQFETTAAEMVAAYQQATTDMPATERLPDYSDVEMRLV